MTTQETIQNLKSLSDKLAECHRLEHGDVLTDDEVLAVDRAKDLLESEA